MSDEDCDRKLTAAKLNPDAIYEEIGGFGRFQLYIYVLICFPLMFIACSNFSYIFIASDREYRCFIPECDVSAQNDSAEWIGKAAPYVDGKISKCERFAAVSLNESDDSKCPWSFNRSHVIKCDTFVFLTDERSLLNEFNLTCESNQWKLTIVGSLGYLAECIALPFIGLIADKYGRRPTLIGSIILVSIFGMSKTFSDNYLTYIVLHFIGSIFGGGAFSLVFVFGSEVVGPNSRGLAAAIISNAVSAAQILLAVITIYISDFRVLLQVLYALIALVLTFIWLVPESVRWLWSVGELEEGVKILKKVAKLNGTEMSEGTLNSLAMHHKNDLLLEDMVIDSENAATKIKENSPVTIFKSKILFIRLANCCYCYFTNALIYFGLSVYSSSLPGDKHINLMYAGVVELFGNAATHYVLKRYGRKWSVISSMLVCSIACIGSELVPNASLKIILFLVGKFAVALSFTILNLYSIELFPTNLRQSMFNTCMTFGGCGNILAPQLPLMRNYAPSLPLILFAGTSFSSALLVLLLPETRNKSMPDTVEEAINI